MFVQFAAVGGVTVQELYLTCKNVRHFQPRARNTHLNLLGEAVDAAGKVFGHHAVFHGRHTDSFQRLGESEET